MKRHVAILFLALVCVPTSTLSVTCLADDQSTVIGSDRNTGGATPGDRQTMDDIKARIARLKQQQQ